MNKIIFLAAFWAALGVSGCFNPDTPDVAFRCGESGECPDGYECRDDGCCHKIGSPDTEAPGCYAPNDAGEDTGEDSDGNIQENEHDAGVD